MSDPRRLSPGLVSRSALRLAHEVALRHGVIIIVIILIIIIIGISCVCVCVCVYVCVINKLGAASRARPECAAPQILCAFAVGTAACHVLNERSRSLPPSLSLSLSLSLAPSLAAPSSLSLPLSLLGTSVGWRSTCRGRHSASAVGCWG